MEFECNVLLCRNFAKGGGGKLRLFKKEGVQLQLNFKGGLPPPLIHPCCSRVLFCKWLQDDLVDLLYNKVLYISMLLPYNCRGEVVEDVWRFLLTGGVALDNPHPNPFPQWLSEKSWGEVVRASELPKLKGWYKGEET